MCLTDDRLHLLAAQSCTSSPGNPFLVMPLMSCLILSTPLRFRLPCLTCTCVVVTLLPVYILLLVLLYVRTNSTYFPALSWMFLPLSLSLARYSVHLCDFTHPHSRHIQLLLLCFLHCSRLRSTVHHCPSYYSLAILSSSRFFGHTESLIRRIIV